MLIEGKDGFNTKMVYQGKAGAVCKAQPPVVNFFKDGLCVFFNIFSDTKDNNVAGLYLVHEFDGCSMTAPGLEKCINLIKDIIGGIKDRFFFLNLFVNEFCSGIMLIFRNGEGTKGACIYEKPQSVASPYRNLSW